MSTSNPTPNPPGPRKFTVERPGHTFTTYIPSAAVAEIRAEVAEEIARDLDEWADIERQAFARSGSDLQAGAIRAFSIAASVAREAAAAPAESVAAGLAVPAEGSGHPQPAECERGVAGDWCARPAGHDGECNATRKLPHPPEVGRLPWPHGADPVTDAWLRSQGLDPVAVAAEVREHIDTLIRRTGGDDRG